MAPLPGAVPGRVHSHTPTVTSSPGHCPVGQEGANTHHRGASKDSRRVAAASTPTEGLDLRPKLGLPDRLDQDRREYLSRAVVLPPSSALYTIVRP